MRKIAVAIFAVAFLNAIITSAACAKDAEKETGNVVSQAAHTAKSEGLKGQDLAEKVHEAIDTRKESKDVVKSEKVATKDAEKKAKKAGEQAKEKVKKDKELKEKRGKVTKQNFGVKGSKGKGK